MSNMRAGGPYDLWESDSHDGLFALCRACRSAYRRQKPPPEAAVGDAAWRVAVASEDDAYQWWTRHKATSEHRDGGALRAQKRQQRAEAKAAHDAWWAEIEEKANPSRRKD